jgi:hypothetical protein
MNKGFIADWVFSEEHGEIHRCSGGVGNPLYYFSWDDCCTPLQSILAEQTEIHADGPCPGPAGAIQLTFKIDLDGNAMEVCLA